VDKIVTCKKSKQLKMPHGTAQNRLRRNIMFHLIKKLNEHFCYRCGEEMTSDDFSIEHKEAWLDKNSDLFWDMGNIAFSHKKCNYGNRKDGCFPKSFDEKKHGTHISYSNGCRCEDCRKGHSEYMRKYRERKAV